VRETATRELEKEGEAISPLLREALAASPSPELRRRLKRLLQRGANWQTWTSQELRALRAVLVLERIGIAGSRKIIERLAQGVPGARLTQAAEAALERLEKRARRSRE
jgi:hypothetical protein